MAGAVNISDLLLLDSTESNEAPGTVESTYSGVNSGELIGGLSLFDSRSSVSTYFPCFLTTSCYRTAQSFCIRQTCKSENEDRTTDGSTPAAVSRLGVVCCPCLAALPFVVVLAPVCDGLVGCSWLGTAGCCCKCFDCPMKLLTPSREGTIMRDPSNEEYSVAGERIRYRELPIRSCVQCVYVSCFVWTRDGEYLSLCCDWQGFQEPHCNWCCGCSAEETEEQRTEKFNCCCVPLSHKVYNLAEEAAAKKEDARFYEEEMSTFSRKQKIKSLSVDECEVLMKSAAALKDLTDEEKTEKLGFSFAGGNDNLLNVLLGMTSEQRQELAAKAEEEAAAKPYQVEEEAAAVRKTEKVA